MTSLTRFFANDFSQVPALAVITEEVPEDHHETIQKELSNLEYGEPPRIVFATDSWSIHQAVRDVGPSIILGSSLDKEIASELAVPQLSVSFPVTDRGGIEPFLCGISRQRLAGGRLSGGGNEGFITNKL